MPEQAAILSQLMGEASAMDVFLEDRIVSRMLRPYERSHVKEGEIPTYTAMSLRATVLVLWWRGNPFKLNAHKVGGCFASTP